MFSARWAAKESIMDSYIRVGDAPLEMASCKRDWASDLPRLVVRPALYASALLTYILYVFTTVLVRRSCETSTFAISFSRSRAVSLFISGLGFPSNMVLPPSLTVMAATISRSIHAVNHGLPFSSCVDWNYRHLICAWQRFLDVNMSIVPTRMKAME